MSRQEENKYTADVEYEVWRHGGNPDMVDRDIVSDYYWNEKGVDEAFRLEIERIYPNKNENEDKY